MTTHESHPSPMSHELSDDGLFPVAQELAETHGDELQPHEAAHHLASISNQLASTHQLTGDVKIAAHYYTVAEKSRMMTRDDEGIDEQADGDIWELTEYVGYLYYRSIGRTSLDEDERWKDASKMQVLQKTLRSGGYSLVAARELIRTCSNTGSRMQDYSMLEMVGDMPSEVLQKIYNETEDESGNGRDTNYLKAILDDTSNHNPRSRAVKLRVLKKVVNDSSDPRLRYLLACFEDSAEIALAELPEYPYDRTPEQISEYTAQLPGAVEAFLAELDFSEESRREYMKAALTRLAHEKTDGIVPLGSLHEELARVRARVNFLGRENLRLLQNKVHAENLSMYSGDELELLVGLLRGDTETIEHLQRGDVAIVFHDVRGDYNGAITSPGFQSATESPTNRTLRFELTQPSDIYRAFHLCRKYGIKPSILFYAAHGAPSATGMGDGEFRIDFMSEAGIVDGPSIDISATALERISAEYMQSNRGIDTDDSIKDRKVMVLLTCSGGVRRSGRQASVAEAVACKAGPDVDVYAASDIMYVDYSHKDGSIVLRRDINALVGASDNVSQVYRASHEAPRRWLGAVQNLLGIGHRGRRTVTAQLVDSIKVFDKERMTT